MADWYSIEVKGTLTPSWDDWFPEWEVAITAETTVLKGTVDQATLYGTITKLRNLGLVLLDISQQNERN